MDREQHTSRPVPRRRALDRRPRGRRAQAHRAEPRDRRGRDPRGDVRDRDQHAGARDRARRGRPHRLHRRGLRRPPRHRRPRPLHRRARRGDRAALGARAPLRRLPHGAVQGALAGGDRGPLLQHALRHLARGRGGAPGGQEPPLVPRALLHPTRRLRPLGGALRRRDRRLLPGPAHRRHREHRDDLLLRRRVPGGRSRARHERRRGRLPAERGGADDRRRLSRRRHLDAPEPRPRALQQRLHALPQRRPGLPAPADGAPVRHRRRQLPHRRLHGERRRLQRLGLQHVRLRDHRHRGAAPVPGHEPELELAQGPPHRGLPAHVRGAHPPGEPLARAGSAPRTPRWTRSTARTSAGSSSAAPTRFRRARSPGARYIPVDDQPPAEAWEGARHLWDEED